MPFCLSCGQILDLSKARCSGCSLTIPQKVRDEAGRSTPQKDTWTRKYCTPPSSTSPRTRASSITSPTHGIRSAQTAATATPTKSRSRTQSQLSRPTSPRPSSRSPDRKSSVFVEETPPIVPTHTGSSTRSSNSLQKVFGSVLQERTPESARCTECRAFFGHGQGEDRTIYPIPGSDPMSTDAFLCFKCFARSYKKDDCPTCNRPVLGIKGDPFVSTAGREYHLRCYRCVRCAKPAHLINIARHPSCNDCFGVSPCCTQQEVAPTPQRPSDSLGGAHRPNATERLVLQFQSWTDDRGKSRASSSGPSVKDMKQRFSFVSKELAGGSSKQSPVTNEFKGPRPPTSPLRGHRSSHSTSSITSSGPTTTAPFHTGRSVLSSNNAPAAPTAASSFARSYGGSDSQLRSAGRTPVPGWRDGALGDASVTLDRLPDNVRPTALALSPSSAQSTKASFDGTNPPRKPASWTMRVDGGGLSAAGGDCSGAKKSILERAGVRHLGR